MNTETQMAADRKVLVLGARGRFGWAVTQAFARAGWQVLAQSRPGRTGQALRGVQWLAMDPDDAAALAGAAAGCSVVVHALNPAYTAAAWKKQVPAFMAVAIEVATRCGALLMLPGNVYNYGSGMPPVLREDTATFARRAFALRPRGGRVADAKGLRPAWSAGGGHPRRRLFWQRRGHVV